jgi:peroxiredoxin
MRFLFATTVCGLLAFAASAMDIGKPSPALTIPQLSGPPLQVSQYKGKVVAIAFIDTNCPHCQNLTKLLNVISKEFAGKPVQILGCAFNDGAQGVLSQFIQTYQPNFPVGYCSRDVVLNYLQFPVLKPLYVPHMVFLDKRGIVRGDFVGESEFMTRPDVNVRNEIDQLLKAGTTTTSSVAHKH